MEEGRHGSSQPLTLCGAFDGRPNPSRLLFESPLVQAGEFRCAVSHPRFSDTGPTPGYCFVFPRTAVWIKHEGREEFVADRNVVPLYNMGHPYRRRRIYPDGDQTDWFRVSPSLLREALRPHDPAAAEDQSRLFRFDFAQASAKTFLRQWRVFAHIRSTESPETLFIEESAIRMLDDLLAGCYGTSQRAPGAAAHRELAEEAKACLNLSFASQQGLTDLAGSVGTSVFHLCRVFRHHTGSTIHRYRNELRIRRSLELLADGRDDILGIAVALGYSGHSHFTAAFRRSFGATPSAIRADLPRFRSHLRGRHATAALSSRGRSAF